MSDRPDVNGILRRFGGHPLLFELIPPTRKSAADTHERRQPYLDALQSRVNVGALNLPEVQEESKKDEKGERKSDFKERVPPREYAQNLSADFPDLQFVINRVIVQETRNEQVRWLEQTYHDFDIENIVLVGGESSEIDYPGPSVTEGNHLVKNELNEGTIDTSERTPTDYRVGNICISTRRKDGFDEPDRMLKKIRAGADFFTTQIVAEAESPLSLMEDLSKQLDEEAVPPPVLFWSFSPIAQQKDVNFLRWLGVRIPDEVEESILGSDNPVEMSIDHARSIWRELNELNDTLPVPIPLGLNISFMGDRNFENAIELAEGLQTVSPTNSTPYF